MASRQRRGRGPGLPARRNVLPFLFADRALRRRRCARRILCAAGRADERIHLVISIERSMLLTPHIPPPERNLKGDVHRVRCTRYAIALLCRVRYAVSASRCRVIPGSACWNGSDCKTTFLPHGAADEHIRAGERVHSRLPGYLQPDSDGRRTSASSRCAVRTALPYTGRRHLQQGGASHGRFRARRSAGCTHPLKRVGPRGAGQFERDDAGSEALDIIHARVSDGHRPMGPAGRACR